MADSFRDVPPYVRVRPDGQWQGADHQNGPWRNMPAPQRGTPWQAPTHTQQPSTIDPTLSDRLALAACPVSMAQSNLTTATPMSNSKPPEWDELSQDTLDVMKDLGEFQPTLDPVKKMVKGYTYDSECGHFIKTYWDSNFLRAIAAACLQVADWLDAVGCHQPDTEPSIQAGWKALECEQDPRMWPPIDPGKETAAIAIARELRGPYG